MILYLAKDTFSLDTFSERFFLNKKEKSILEDFHRIRLVLNDNQKKYTKFSPSNWTEFIEGNHLDPETVKLLICEGTSFWKSFLKWLLVYRFIKSDKTGNALKEKGWESGKELGAELKRLRYNQIDNY